MRHLKIYERYRKIPKIGDYVITHEFNINDRELNKFLDNNIGKYIRNVEYSTNDKYPFLIQFDNIDGYIEYFNINEKTRCFSLDEIVDFSPNREDLEHYIAGNKYNL